MKFTAHNIRSIAKADMDIDGITLVLGQNQAGKTTLLNTVAACMLGERNLYGATAKDASPVLRNGEEVASASLQADDEDWGSGLIWPAYDHKVHGFVLPPANKITMGRVDPAGDFKPKEWADFVRTISGAGRIKGDQVMNRLKVEAGETWTGEIEGVMALLKQGWDVAAKHAETKRQEARRRWEKITGDRFGTSKADGWHAEALDDVRVINDPNFDDLLAETKAEVERLEAAARRADVKAELFDTDIPTFKADILERGGQSNKLGGDLERLRRREADLRKELSFYPHTDPLACPHCGAMVEIKSGKIAKHEQGKYIRGSDEHKKLETELTHVQNEIADKSHERGKLVAAMEADQVLLKRLQDADGMASGNEVDSKAIELAKTRHHALVATRDAANAYSEWSFWNVAYELLAPTGLRMQATIAALKELNPRIAKVAADLFPGCEVALHSRDDGIDLGFKGAAHSMHSAATGKQVWMTYKRLVWEGDPNSYALRIQILFQILEAQRLGAGAFVIIDRFDTLEKRHKNGVFTALNKAGITALIGQTANEKPAKDALAQASVGRTYWINDGVVETSDV